MAIALTQLVKTLDQWLEPGQVKDYCPNGLQVEGRPQVRRIVSGVTASQALLDAAVLAKADAVLVHHGYFWRGEDPCVRGMKRRRLQTLLEHDISLIAYHLPLDIHPQLGNNAQLARRLGLTIEGGLELNSRQPVGLWGRLEQPLSATQLAERLETELGRRPQWIEGRAEQIETLGWCTGAAQGYIEHAIARGLDGFISGEISEPTVYAAREGGVHYFGAGHHATERYGVQALGQQLADQFDIEHCYIELDNPV
ncbi:Nif3-like dinuclear metal center hexameric protein [Motiliproteus coralliicola]|uniref:GTP cyclohydrolase 1 type 2 homolog n=1 Tax=Motiliproteus coralliicola TaxID=2283196 RepID=A0A369WLU9_9GAMM|nr:Nif3-like dinuclear metal center hexameric protein [Motiliproteus coralliicola]RDE23050.1 Nif3-like dinuclear metal center hexameric protein [Motiliproteus coralliicola]